MGSKVWVGGDKHKRDIPVPFRASFLCQWRLIPAHSLFFNSFPFFPSFSTSSYYSLLSKKWAVPLPPPSSQPLSLLVPSSLTMRCTLTILAGPTRTHGIPTLTLFSRMRCTRHLSLPFPWSLSPQSRAAMAPCHPSTLAGAPHLPNCPLFPGRSRHRLRTWSCGSVAHLRSTDSLHSLRRVVTRPLNFEVPYRNHLSCPLRHSSESTPANSIACGVRSTCLR